MKDPNKPKDVELTKSEIEEKIKDSHPERTRKYTKGKFLGRGGFARCYEFICQDNKKRFAAKAISKINLAKERDKKKLITEIRIHKSLHHCQIVAFEHNFEDNDFVYILLEICNNQTLNELLKRRKTLTEIEVQCYLIQLIQGLKYLHSHKIIHRDLKLGNLFLTDKMQLKIGDFGLATKLDYDGEKKKTLCGTPNYIAPEVFETNTGHSYEVDIWAVGIIMYALLIGKPPFEKKDTQQTYKNIKTINYSFPEGAKISEPAKNLIRRILVKDPKERPSFDEILADDFFNQGALIPTILPTASLAVAPTLEYIRKYMPNADENGICHMLENKPKEENNQSNQNENDVNSTKESSSNKNNNNNEEQNEDDNKEKNKKLKGAEVYVTKWVDYSSKYGLGYLLNNGNIGIYFNDCSKLLFNSKTNGINYVERKMTEEKDMIYSFDINGAPKELNKKILIFQNFKKYFDEEIKADKEREEKKEEAKLQMCKTSKVKIKKVLEKKNTAVESTPRPSDSVFVRKWMKTKQSFIFRLSNKTIQFGFKDHTEVLFYNDIITYKDKKGEYNLYTIDDALNGKNFEMIKRIKYAQNILTKMINNNLNKNE